MKHQRKLTGLKSLSTNSNCILNIKSTFLDLPLSNICYYFAGKLAQCIWCSQIFHDLCNKTHYHNLSKELYFHTQVESIEHCSIRDCSFVLESSNSSCFVLLGLYLNEFAHQTLCNHFSDTHTHSHTSNTQCPVFLHSCSLFLHCTKYMQTITIKMRQ